MQKQARPNPGLYSWQLVMEDTTMLQLPTSVLSKNHSETPRPNQVASARFLLDRASADSDVVKDCTAYESVKTEET